MRKLGREPFITYVREAIELIAEGQYDHAIGQGHRDMWEFEDELQTRWYELARESFASVTDDDTSIVPAEAVYRPANAAIRKSNKGKTAQEVYENTKQQPRKMCKVVKGPIHHCYHYNPETGVISRRVQWTENGCLIPRSDNYTADLEPVRFAELAAGYLYITIDNTTWLAHHLAWYLTYEVKPKQLQFVDGDKTNLKLSNLKLVSWGIARPYQARVRVSGRIVCLGSYPTLKARDEAVNAFRAAMGIKARHRVSTDVQSVPHVDNHYIGNTLGD